MCIRPIQIGSNLYPCGKCCECLNDYRNNWVFRLKYESKLSKFSVFVTLTYSDENLPLLNGVPSLCKRDFQLFFKRLRKLYPKQLRYFLTGEYGPATLRPHAHAILFFSIDFTQSLYDNIIKCWDKGFVTFGELTGSRIGYTTKYCLKLSPVPKGVEQPFRLISSKPAIGFGYLEQMGSYHKREQNFSFVSNEGTIIKMPRYYRDKLAPSKFLRENLDSLRQKREEAEIRKVEDIQRKFKWWCKINHSDDWNAFVLFMQESSNRKDNLFQKHIKKTIL